MRISLLTPQQTRRHLANTSTAKNACPFPRQKRFSPANPECPQAFYLKDKSQLSKITFKIPSSKRSDFTKTLTCSPASTKYLQKSFFEVDGKKGKTFGTSREKSPDRSYIKKHLQKIPGPGQYQNMKEVRSTSSYSLRSKPSDFISDKLSYRQNPGPGTYNDINLLPKGGRMRLSKYQDTKLAKISPNTKRFLEIKYAPGPSDYVRKDEFSSQGSYILSKHKGEGTRPFNRDPKIDFTERFRKLSLTLPGPFQYKKPSDFGVYGDVNYYRSFNSTIS